MSRTSRRLCQIAHGAIYVFVHKTQFSLTIFHIPALWYFDIFVICLNEFVESNLILIPHDLHGSNTYEVLLYNRKLGVITYELIHIVRAAHRQGQRSLWIGTIVQNFVSPFRHFMTLKICVSYSDISKSTVWIKTSVYVTIIIANMDALHRYKEYYLTCPLVCCRVGMLISLWSGSLVVPRFTITRFVHYGFGLTKQNKLRQRIHFMFIFVTS